MIMMIVLVLGTGSGAVGPWSVEASAEGAGKLVKSKVEQFADDFFHDPMIQEMMAGAVFVVVQGEDVVLKKGYGMANMEKGEPFDPDHTVFRVASVSKAITATAVMQLVEQGKLDLHEDMNTYLDFNIPNKTDTPLTMRNLLTNATGFAFGDTSDLVSFDMKQDIPLGQYMADHIPEVVYTPGEYYRYDNHGFNLQGYVVEHVSGVPFHDYVSSRIFEPLGMMDSDFLLTEQLTERLAAAYDVEGQPIPTYTMIPAVHPAGGMLSTGADMAKFMMAHLSSGKLGDTRILQEETAREMHKPQLYAHPDLPNMAYGFEFSQQQVYNGHTVVEKGGDVNGYHTGMWLLPEEEVGVFVSVNKDIEFRSELFGAFMDRFYPGEASTPAYEQPQQPALSAFEGIYGDLRNRMWTSRVRAVEDKLQVEDPFGVHILTRIDGNLFEDEHGVRAAFKLDDSMNVTAYYYDLKSDSWARKLPEPERYADVEQGHAYADYIYHLRQLDVIGDQNGDQRFRPEEQLTRGEFISWFIRWTGIALSTNPFVFTDIADSPYAREIQTAYEFGLIAGQPDGTYQPDRLLTRQEAAAIARRLSVLHLYAEAIEAQPDGETDAWALEGVRFVIEKQLYGPEVMKSEDGTVMYESKRPMLRQEAAALLSLFADNLL